MNLKHMTYDYILMNFINSPITSNKIFYIQNNLMKVYDKGNIDIILLNKKINIDLDKVDKFFSISDRIFIFQIEYEIIYVKNGLNNDYVFVKLFNMKNHLDFEKIKITNRKTGNFTLFKKTSFSNLIDSFYCEYNKYEDYDISYNCYKEVFIKSDNSKLILYDYLNDKEIHLVFLTYKDEDSFTFDTKEIY